MTRTASIVSFDDAKRSRAARARARREQADALSASERPLVYFDPGADARFNIPSNRTSRSAASASVSQRPSSRRPRHARQDAAPLATPSASRGVAASRRGAADARVASRAASPAAGRRSPSWYDGPDERALREETARRAQVRQEAREIEEEEQGKKASPLQKLRRSVAKRKADKVFGAEGAAPSGEGGPRAALYKGEMGSSQRRASRMQGGSDSDADGSPRRSKKGFAFGPKMRIAAAVLGCLALVCVFLYQPAQQCYQSMRERDALAVEYNALQERGDALQSNVDALSSEAGIEDLAHEQYGLVKKGEVSVNVSGVSDSSDEDSTIPPNVSADSIDPPDTWYSGILDPLFGVE